MTSVSSYGLYECPECSQLHIAPIYGTLNFAFSGSNTNQTVDGHMFFCQRCSIQMRLANFKYLGVLDKRRPDHSSALTKFFKRHLIRNYKSSEPDPWRLYPRLETTPFNPDTWMPEWARKRMRPEDFPDWHKELMEFRVDKN